METTKSLSYSLCPSTSVNSAVDQTTLSIQLPQGNSGEFLSLANSYLDFQVSIPYTGSAITAAQAPYTRQGIGSFFNNIRVFLGSTLIETISSYNIWQQQLAYSECNADRLNANWNEGYYDPAMFMFLNLGSRHYQALLQVLQVKNSYIN